MPLPDQHSIVYDGNRYLIFACNSAESTRVNTQDLLDIVELIVDVLAAAITAYTGRDPIIELEHAQQEAMRNVPEQDAVAASEACTVEIPVPAILATMCLHLAINTSEEYTAKLDQLQHSEMLTAWLERTLALRQYAP